MAVSDKEAALYRIRINQLAEEIETLRLSYLAKVKEIPVGRSESPEYAEVHSQLDQLAETRRKKLIELTGLRKLLEVPETKAGKGRQSAKPAKVHRSGTHEPPKG